MDWLLLALGLQLYGTGIVLSVVFFICSRVRPRLGVFSAVSLALGSFLTAWVLM